MAYRSDIHLARQQQSGHLPMNLEECYKFANFPGKYLIFNHYKFNIEGKKLSDRDGTEKDVTAIMNTFATLGFEGERYDDLSSPDIIDIIKEAFKGNFDEHASLFVFILTHGDINSTLCSYNDIYKLEEYLQDFMEIQSPSLVGKPKVFIIQACQGVVGDSGIGSSGYGEDGNSNFKLPTLCDHLLAYAAPNGYQSFRNENGTCFIQTLCKSMNDNYKKEDFETILKVARREVARINITVKNQDQICKQIPIAITALIKTFYLTREAFENNRRH